MNCKNGVYEDNDLSHVVKRKYFSPNDDCFIIQLNEAKSNQKMFITTACVINITQKLITHWFTLVLNTHNECISKELSVTWPSSSPSYLLMRVL